MAVKSLLSGLKMPRIMGKHSDVLFAIGAVLVIMMLIIPMPTMVLDFLLIVDIILALLILLMVLNIKSSSEFTVFPSLLLIMTAFRLALNVSSTRLILTQGTAFRSQIITSFAEFVVAGNIVVGIIIFIILIIVQFVVITKGATRVAEVAARFSLDSMNSKMMAVESELQTGAITDKEAEDKRRAIREESDFYGTMDGASKFVQGDVIAGLIITVLNILGGLIIGIVMRGESLSEASRAYLRFTIGDGLVTQIPAFFMSFATGLLVTRSSSSNSLSEQVTTQTFSKPKNMYIGAGFALILMFLPGFPKIMLLVVALLLAAAGYILSKQEKELGTEVQPGDVEATNTKTPLDVSGLLKVEPIELSIGTMLIPLADETEGGDLLTKVTHIRRELALGMGIVVPPIRITDNIAIEAEEYIIKINGTEVAKSFVRGSMLLALNQKNDPLPIEDAEKTIEPAFGFPAYWIPVDNRDIVERAGFMIFSPTAVIATHLTEVLRKHADVLLGREEVQKILNMLKDSHPSLVSEVLMQTGQHGGESPLGYIQKVMQNLLLEGVSIRDTVSIVEAVADTMKVMSSDQATEFVRTKLSTQISQQLADVNKVLHVVILSQALQEEIAGSLASNADMRGGTTLALNHEQLQRVVKKLRDAVGLVNEKGYEPVFFVSPLIRKALQQLIVKNIGKYNVIATTEIANGYKVEALVVVQP